jgi:hypothetical protein
MRVAFSRTAWNTGSSSPGELEIHTQHLGGRSLLLQRLGKVLPGLGEFAPVFFELLV